MAGFKQQITERVEKKAVTELVKSDRKIQITIKNKNGTVIDEDVKAVSSYNQYGIFDVLPLHTHFISLIRKKIIVRNRKDGTDREMDIGTGLMKVDDNKVDIYVGLPDVEQQQK
jgi:F0F1-type ATP synthase epsilon subunit